MKWNKIGNIFCPDKNSEWMWTHAANPVPFVLDEDKGLVRVFFTSRTVNNKSHIGYVDINFNDNYKLQKISESPVISPGTPGLFDEDGAAMGCLVKKDNLFYLFYLGWNLKVSVPWLNTIGLATSKKINDTFIKYSMAPIMDRSNEDPYSISYPSVIFDDGIFKMWYGSNLSWGKSENSMLHVIKYAESTDLIHWKRTNEIHINLIHKNEFALSKPWVIKNGGEYQMWYSYRGNGDINTYRIGMAISKDAKDWTRNDRNAGIDVSEGGWDSEMICYPSVFNLKENTFMLYNGNGYGKTGFGLAILEK